MKTEKEIRDEIEALNREDDNYRKAHKARKIPKDVLKSHLSQNSSMRLALKWVLGENDRYD
jgi:hypothetical protein